MSNIQHNKKALRRNFVNKLLIPEVLGGNIIIPVSLQRVHNIKQMPAASQMVLIPFNTR